MSHRVLVIGGAGMLGHELVRRLARRFETWATVRSPESPPLLSQHLSAGAVFTAVDAADPLLAEELIGSLAPTVVVNCAGIVKQRPEARDPLQCIPVNALFPHHLAAACARSHARLIHLSTDCVFSGRRGNYSERDLPDPEDLYGRSKLLGEPEGAHCLTIRTSMIGHELSGESGLLEWFLRQKGAVTGFERAIFSGLSTPALSRVLETIIEVHPNLSGLYHVASEPISKYDLLVLLRDAFGLPLEIVRDSRVVVDRSLDGRRFQDATGFVPTSWLEMTKELAAMKSTMMPR